MAIRTGVLPHHVLISEAQSGSISIYGAEYFRKEITL